MEIIIITAAVSVFSTLVIVYFIWAGIRAHKLNKTVKGNTEDVKSLYNEIHLTHEVISTKEQEIYAQMNQVDNELEKNVDEKVSEIYNQMSQSDRNLDDRIDEVINKFDEYDTELHKELDRRFEKIYQTLNEKK